VEEGCVRTEINKIENTHRRLYSWACVWCKIQSLLQPEKLVPKHEAMKMRWVVGGILNLGAVWRWVATFTLRMLYPRYLYGPQFLSLLNGKGKICTTSRSLIPVNQSLPLTSLIELARLICFQNISWISPVNMQMAVLQWWRRNTSLQG
jgi:hypothetical protein